MEKEIIFVVADLPLELLIFDGFKRENSSAEWLKLCEMYECCAHTYSVKYQNAKPPGKIIIICNHYKFVNTRNYT